MSETKRTWPLGKRYDGGEALVEAEHIVAFALATNDENPSYFGTNALAPPIFHMRLFRDLVLEILLDPELSLDVMRLVHGEHDVSFFAPIRAGDRVAVGASLDHVAEKATGTVVVLRYTAHIRGEPVLEARSSFFVRRSSPRVEDGHRRSTPSTRGEAEIERRIDVGLDQSYRYAEASLDSNPIHVQPEVARAVGFDDVILQGLATMAMTGAGAIWALAEGDPLRLERFAVRFVRPVYNGAHLRAGFWRRPDGSFDVETSDLASGALHLGGVVSLRHTALGASGR
jgi:acyl dehydratase